MTASSKPLKLSAAYGGATATAVASIANGTITGVTLVNGGSGYTAPPDVIISGGGGSGAYISASIANGSVSALKVITGGQGYTSTPDIIISLDQGAAQLSYSMLPNPYPLQVPQTTSQFSTLTLIVSNSGSEIVYVSSITVTLPGPSQNAQDLTDSFNGIGVQVPSLNNNPLWTVSQVGGQFTLTPINEAVGQIGAAGVDFVFDQILVNNSVGICAVNITEAAGSATQPYGSRSAPPISLEKWPSQFSMAGPTASPIQVNYDGSTLVKWSVTGTGVTTVLMYDPDGKGLQTYPEPNVNAVTVNNLTNPQGVIFTLQATVMIPGTSESMVYQQQVTVSVVPQPQVTFNIAPNPIVPGNPLTFTLSWSVVDVSNFQIIANDGPNGDYSLGVPVQQQGNFVVTPKKLNVTYTFQVLSTATSE